jgi:ubiquinone/menaquinone biosynthesis C-methylase UbiE
MDRVLEAEVMDSAAEADDYDAMDHSHVNQAFVTDLLHLRNPFTTILDVGTGTAQIPLELCRRQLEVNVVAIDMARTMLQIGQRNIERAGVAERIKLQRCDAKRIPFPDRSFDAVMSNSIVHHIPEPFTVLAEMRRVVKPGGLLFVRDLLRPVNEGTLQHLVQQYARGANVHQRQMFADSLHAALTLAEVQAMVTRLGFNAATVQQTSDRHWTWAA